MNIELRSDGYYAVLMIPKDLRPHLGKLKHLKKLTARNKAKASQEAARFVYKWKQDFKQLRESLGLSKSNPHTAIYQKALGFREQIRSASRVINDEIGLSERDELELLLANEAEELEDMTNRQTGELFYDVGIGRRTPLQPLFEDWSINRLKGHTAKTQDSYRRDCLLFLETFPDLESITRSAVKAWINDLLDKGTSLHTLKNRILCAIRHFYKYLDTKGLVDDDVVDPLHKILPQVARTKSTTANKGWIPLTPDEVVRIYSSVPEGDPSLKFLVLLGMFTGARIEELCSLRISDLTTQNEILCFSINDSKTRAGIRLVPVHSILKPVVEFAIALPRAKDYPYLIPGLTRNKYGHLSNGIGKRFGRLKKSLNLEDKQVYHSIRKCVITQLERKGLPESIVADLVGHEKDTITYGLYSGGSSLEAILGAVESIEYPLKT